MNTRLLKQLERASRVMVFCREHAAEVPTEQQVVSVLDALVTRAESVEREVMANAHAAREAIAERVKLRSTITVGLRLLARTAEAAGTEVTGTPFAVSVPDEKNGQWLFLQGGRQVLEVATERAELLGKHGLPAGLLATLTTDLERFADLLVARDNASQRRVAARRELRAVVSAIGRTVMQLAALFRFRFHDDPAALRGWATATDLRVGPRKPAETGDPGIGTAPSQAA